MVASQKMETHYQNLLPVTHIGIMDYTLFPEMPRFYSEYQLRERQQKPCLSF